MGQYGKLYNSVENSDNNQFVLTPSIVNAVVSVQDSNDISRYILPHVYCGNPGIETHKNDMGTN